MIYVCSWLLLNLLFLLWFIFKYLTLEERE
jgi:hypothetical protein